MFRNRFISRHLARRNLFEAAHDRTFNLVIQPAIIGGVFLFVAYGTARNQKAKAVAYRDPYYPPIHVAPAYREAADWVKAGIGDYPYYSAKKGCVFSEEYVIDTPPVMLKHTNAMAETLNADPALWTELKDRRTTNGVTLIKVIKPGVDLPDSKVGLVAGDEDSYEEFKELFDPVIEKCHGFKAGDVSTSNFDIAQITDSQIDPSGEIVLATTVKTSRNLRGYNLPPSTGFLERRAVEKAVVKSLQSLEGDLSGEYMPLHGSRSFVQRRHGMSNARESELKSMGAAGGPERMEMLSSGSSRHWPDARGVYNNQSGDVFVTVNDEDHLQIMTYSTGTDIQANAARFADASKAIVDALQSQGYEFMTSERLGNITTSPANLGNALRAGAKMNIPNLSSRSDFSAIVRDMGLEAENCVNGVCDVSNSNVLGKTEVELVNMMIAGTSKLVQLETTLANGGSV